MALVSVSAAPANADSSVLAAAEEAMIADFYFKDCISGTNKIIHLEDGAIEYICRKKANRNDKSTSQHHFGTNLFVTTSSGGIEVSIGGNGGGFTGSSTRFRYAGYLDSDWGTSRAVVYPAQRSIDAVVNLDQKCTNDGVFCFDVKEHVCIFGYSNRVWRRACPLLMVIKFDVSA
ncbi:hypothetical protein BGW42_002483 [Actinomortierella wolfii]|nr:hypothetical protein BGW42_002483 [Actinomortierella wolfii]